MGSSCGVFKQKDKQIKQILFPVQRKQNAPDLQKARIGPYLVPQLPSDKLLQRLGKWNKMLNLYCTFTEYLKDPTRYMKLLRRIRKGPPVQYRWQVWQSIVCASESTGYNELELVSEPLLSTIQKDLPRTFPSHPYFCEHNGMEALKRVLGKFAAKHPSIGYCQGMNFVAGFLLMVSGGAEAEVLGFLEVLSEDFGLAGFFKENMPHLKKCMYVFKEIFKEKLPSLAEHFEQEGFVEDSWLLRWFMTLFTIILPMNCVLRVWDYLVIDRTVMLFKTALAILYLYEDKLLNMDAGEISSFFSELKDSQIDPEALVKQASNIKVNKSKVNKLEKTYFIQTRTKNNLHSTPPCYPRTSHIKQESLPAIKKDLTPQLHSKKSPKIKRTLSVLEDQKNTAVPTLPAINRSRNNTTFFKTQEVDNNESGEEEETLDARAILKELLRDKSEDSMPKLESFQRLPKKNNEFDKKIHFIEKLPI